MRWVFVWIALFHRRLTFSPVVLHQLITRYAMDGKHVFDLLPTSCVLSLVVFLTAHDSGPRFGVESPPSQMWAHNTRKLVIYVSMSTVS